MGNIVGKKDEKSKSHLIKSLEAHKGGVNSIEVSSDLSVLVSGSDDNTVRLWNIKNEPYDCIGMCKIKQKNAPFKIE